RGQLSAALADFNAAVQLSPAYVHALTNRGVARRESGDLPGALVDFDEALRINPSHIDAVRNRALALRESGDLPAAAVGLTAAPACGGRWRGRPGPQPPACISTWPACTSCGRSGTPRSPHWTRPWRSPPAMPRPTFTAATPATTSVTPALLTIIFAASGWIPGC